MPDRFESLSSCLMCKFKFHTSSLLSCEKLRENMIEGAGALLLQKMDEYLKDSHQLNMNSEVREELGELREDVLHLTTQMMRAERQSGLVNNGSLNSWIRSLREIIYNVEDEVDKVMLMQHDYFPGRTIRKQLAAIRSTCNAMGINKDKTESSNGDNDICASTSLIPASAEDPDVNIADTALVLSYNVLEFPLKHILLYCCLFPTDRNIQVRKLIRLCVAEGFAKDKRHITAEKTIATYLKQLIDQNLILATRTGFSGNLETCRVSDTLRNLLLPAVENGRFREFCMYKSDTQLRPKDVRHWSVVGNSSSIPSNKDDVAFVRSCFMSNIENLQASSFFLSLLGGLRLLRVLDLKGAYVPENLLQRLGDLIFLHYLGLRQTNIKTLPPLSNLHSLQTLDIRETQVTNLTASIMRNGQLRHIHLAGSFVRKVVDVPLGRGKLQPLQIQTLAGARATTQLIKELRHCTLLQKLSIGDVRSDDSSILCAFINSMESLRSLTIKTFRVEKLQMETLSDTRDWSSIDTLKIGGPVESLPRVVHCFRSLSRLNLWDSKLDGDPFLYLQSLQVLAFLCLSNVFEGRQLMCGATGFPGLKKLSILRMRKLECWKIVKGGMPILEELFVGYCPKLKEVPQGLEGIAALQLVRVSEMPQEFTMAMEEMSNDRFTIQCVPQFAQIR